MKDINAAPDPIEAQYGDLIDTVGFALEDHATARGMTPSEVGRKAKCRSYDARRILDWLVANRLAVSSGNGAWTRYHPWPGRAAAAAS